MATRAFHSERARSRALRAVGTELRMMAHSFALLRRAELTDTDPMAQNAYIDSAHLRARAMVEFLVQTSTRASDIRRTDFASEWSSEPSEAVYRLKANYVLLHKYLAHLTWERVDPDAPAFDYPKIATDVINVAAAWSEHLGSENKLMWEVFQPHVDLARQTIEELEAASTRRKAKD